MVKLNLKLRALSMTKADWKRKVIELYDNFEEHCMKYQLWHTDALIKEIYAYSKPWGARIIKGMSKYPTKEMMLKVILDLVDSKSQYISNLTRNYIDFKDDYPEIDFFKVDFSKLYNNYTTFLDKWCEYLEQGGLAYNMQICKDLCKKYL